jgi:hypothetical protein
MEDSLLSLEKLLQTLQGTGFNVLELSQVKIVQQEIMKISKLKLSKSKRECLEKFLTHLMKKTIRNDYTDDNGDAFSFKVCNNLEVETLADFIAKLKE